ncbi:MAG: hypothetical protein KTR32_26125 [Granulosicoccus sp.]|nr:hypothetical protein [Granulosicoccus sp.]
MQSKRFFAENSKMAFQMVKESLGPDAIIISNRSTDGGVEIIASETLIEENKSPAEESGLPEPEFQLNTLVEPAGERGGIRVGELQDLKKVLTDELNAIKIGSWKERDTDRYALFQKLLKLGFSIKLVSRIVTFLEDEGDYQQMENDAIQEIIWSLNTGPLVRTPVEDMSGIVMLHGATGAGKTTTIAKIASMAVAAHSAEDVVLVCADNRRMGGYQQLLGYGKILEIPVLHVRRSTELPEILSAVKSKKLVLVDNAGVTPTELKDVHLSPAFNCDMPEIKHYLAIAATTQAGVLNQLLSAPWKDQLEGLIITKADEALQLGECISCLIDSHLPALLVSSGRNIHQDLNAVSADELVNDAVRLGELYADLIDEGVNLTAKTLLHNELKFLH